MLTYINTTLDHLPGVLLSFCLKEVAFYASFSQFVHHERPYVPRFSARWVVDNCDGLLSEVSLFHLNWLSSLLYNLAKLPLIII